MGFYKNDSDGRKITLFPSDGDNFSDDILWATEQGLVTKAGGTDDPNASPELYKESVMLLERLHKAIAPHNYEK